MKLQLAGILIVAALIISSCEPSETPQNMDGVAHVQFKLIDFPADYDAVLIDVVGLKYKLETEDEESEDEDDENDENDDNEENTSGRIFHSEDDDEDDEGEWIDVTIEPTVYDLLELNNGAEALLAEVDIEAGELKGVRVILGPNNKVVVDGDTLDLKVPSGSTSGLKIKVDADIEEGQNYDVIVDFDAAKSVLKTGNGKYLLKPVIRVSIVEGEEELFGSISGVVFPADLNTVVYAVDGEDDSVSAIPEENGAYLIEMLSVGDYFVVAIPGEESGFDPITVAPVDVMADQVTELDSIKFE